MTVTYLFHLLGQIGQAYRPLMPVRATKQLLTVGGHPAAALQDGGSVHWVVIACVAVAAATLIGVARADANLRHHR